MNEQCEISSPHFFHLKRISWSAIIVGALIGLGISFLLNLFSIAIGLSVVKTTSDGLASLAIGGLIGILIGTIVSTFASGFAAGYLGRPFCSKRNLGIVYGFTTWCVAFIMIVVLASSVGRYVAEYTSFIANPKTVVVVNDQQTPAVSTPNTSNVVVNAQAATNNLGYAASVIFALFFIGALSSCIGGHCGMVCKNCNDDCNQNPTIR